MGDLWRLKMTDHTESPSRPKSYHVIIRGKQDPSVIEAPAWFATPEEAKAFGELSVKVLSWFAWLDAWKIASSDVAPTHVFHGGELMRLGSTRRQ
jgi:hypothetical protein